MTLFFSAGIAALTMAAVPASATTYVLNRTVAGGTAVGTITTDGTVGVLDVANITDFDITVTTTGAGNIVKAGKARFIGAGRALIADATGLSFDFSVAGTAFALFYLNNRTFYCLQTNGCFDSLGPAETVASNLLRMRAAQSGRLRFAAVAGATVPEPASWAMMIVGFGLIGRAVRRDRRGIGAVRA
jgi:hypothetical protein